MTTPSPIDRIVELEKEVKALTRLVKEMAAREKVMATRLGLVARDHAQTAKSVKALNTAAQKTDAKISHVQSIAQRKNG